MRPRHKKHFDERFERAKTYLVENPAELKGKWREEFGRDAEVHLEVGCGKGGFIIGKAIQHPEINFVAMEVVPDVVLAAMEKLAEASEARMAKAKASCKGTQNECASSKDAASNKNTQSECASSKDAASSKCAPGEGAITNVRFILGNAVCLGEYFTKDEVDQIYVNFSDPWPRQKQYKNRLTHINFLNIYKGFLKDGGVIAQKTDNKDLFDFSVESLRANGFTVTILESEPEDNVRTEYEQRFIDKGEPINRLTAVLDDRAMHGEETKRKARYYTHGN